ncbi:hypothetical protein N7474_001079 [Penicillium riverlandense]|uniref:uncharacterized protein n=1 Tax=Penicillium riverlandense TaxID=1903569 RepID=UPI002547FE6E|nr:uncharacterized protein N7474_001079 [Penicillium riverlandense]KAJ5832768.1 hypothetical protein N7474_001079 [Penicillium riverlandense]
MRLNTLSVLTFISTVAAMPPAFGHSNGMGNMGNTDGLFPVPDDMTIDQAQAKCGNEAQLSCCNKARYAKDTTDAEKGILAGALSNLISGGSASEGVGLFQECSQLDLQIPILIGIPLQDLVKKKCQQNIACCQNSPSSADHDGVGAGLPCITLGALL